MKQRTIEDVLQEMEQFLDKQRRRLWPQILVIGGGKAGKTTAAEILAGLTNSVVINASDVLTEELRRNPPLEYEGVEPSDGDLFHFGWCLCEEDPAWLLRRCLERGNIVTAHPSRREFHAACDEKLFDLVIWIGRDTATPTYELKSDDADEVILNNGTIDELRAKLCGMLCRRFGTRQAVMV